MTRLSRLFFFDKFFLLAMTGQKFSLLPRMFVAYHHLNLIIVLSTSPHSFIIIVSLQWSLDCTNCVWVISIEGEVLQIYLNNFSIWNSLKKFYLLTWLNSLTHSLFLLNSFSQVLSQVIKEKSITTSSFKTQILFPIISKNVFTHNNFVFISQTFYHKILSM